MSEKNLQDKRHHNEVTKVTNDKEKIEGYKNDKSIENNSEFNIETNSSDESSVESEPEVKDPPPEKNIIPKPTKTNKKKQEESIILSGPI